VERERGRRAKKHWLLLCSVINSNVGGKARSQNKWESSQKGQVSRGTYLKDTKKTSYIHVVCESSFSSHHIVMMMKVSTTV
jgi:hypothetical protein